MTTETHFQNESGPGRPRLAAKAPSSQNLVADSFRWVWHLLTCRSRRAGRETATVILLNGSIGVGKTTVARHLLLSLDRVALIDGEIVTLVRPFDPHNRRDFDHACRTIRLLLDRHASRGITTFIVTWILEDSDQVRLLCAAVCKNARVATRAFLLLCEADELIRRVKARNRPDVAEETDRARELSDSFWARAASGEVGYPIDTSELGPEAVAAVIRKVLSERRKAEGASGGDDE